MGSYGVRGEAREAPSHFSRGVVVTTPLFGRT